MDDKQLESAALTAELAELREAVAYLSARQQISDVYRRYMRGFDRNDVELLRSTVWPDFQINYGEQANTFDEFVARHLDDHTAHTKTWGHLITNETVEIDGDVAHLETYVTGLFMPKQDNGEGVWFGVRPLILAGRYIDRLDRRDGEWRIAVREFRAHFSAGLEDLRRGLSWPDSQWNRNDISYRRPLERRSGT